MVTTIRSARLRRARRVVVSLVGLAVAVAWAAPLTASASPSRSSATERVVGTATVTEAPPGWSPSDFYLQICPAGQRFSMECSGQRSGSPDQSTGAFSVTLPAKPWKIGMYYYTINGQIILNRGVVLAGRPGATIRHNIAMAYVVPAVDGTVRLTGAPKNFDSLAYMGVQSCPATVDFSVGCRGGDEAYEDVGPGTPYLIDLPGGRWSVAAYYWVDGNAKNFTGAPVTFVARPGSTQLVNVTMAYQGV